MGFSTLNLNKNLIKAITQQGYQEPTPIQLEAIPAILNKQDVMAGAQTGTGKTAAFALPILDQLLSAPERQGKLRALVLTPTRELAQQVAKSFQTYGEFCDLTTTIAYGGISIKNQVDALKAGVDILVATPGRLLDHLVKGTVSLDDIEFVVFDEADRMLDMGFIIDIKRILKRMPEQRQTMLFSATFDDAIFNLSKTMLNDPKLIEVNDRNTAATQVQQTIYGVDSDRKRELTSYLIGSRNWQQVLIFTRTKQGCDALAKEMCKDGIKTQSIHGDKSQGARERALSEFKAGKIRALVATDVAARGIDIDHLQYVINYELPYIAEDYIHRIGRTGRAGSSGIAISLLSSEENYLLEAVEAVLDTRIPQEWIPGFEPDLNKVFDNKKNSNSAQKKRANDRAFGGNNKSRNRRR